MEDVYLLTFHSHSRTLTPLTSSHAQLDEQSMSSGDESDDDGLTDGESSASDWSDTGESFRNLNHANSEDHDSQNRKANLGWQTIIALRITMLRYTCETHYSGMIHHLF